MNHALIIGSGPAAVGAALALVGDGGPRVTVLDIGNRLDPDRKHVVERLASMPRDRWDPVDVDAVRLQPIRAHRRGLPQKRAYGSAFPFEDRGQLVDVTASGHVNESVVSGAFGGLSNVWGAQVMPFTESTFRSWPVTLQEMEPHYRAMLSEIPFTGEVDALAEHFPLLVDASPLPRLAPRTLSVLDAFDRHRASLESMGVTVGRARLALRAATCVRCGLCMTGCPYSLIYSAAHSFERLRARGQVDYHDGLLVTEIGQDGDVPYVVARDLHGDGGHRFEADRVFVACGAVGTTRLVLSSLGIFDQEIQLAESAQFVLPMISTRPTPDLRVDNQFTLNQFNMVITLDDEWHDVSQVHFYPHNDALLDALPFPLNHPLAKPIADQILRRLTVGLGYLPSWASPVLRMRVLPPRGAGDIAGIHLSGNEEPALGNPMFRRVVTRMVRAGQKLDLWPAVPMAALSPPGKSYHFGGSLPHRQSAADGALDD